MDFDDLLIDICESIIDALGGQFNLPTEQENILGEAYTILAFVKSKETIIQSVIDKAAEYEDEFEVTSDYIEFMYREYLDKAFHDKSIYRRVRSIENNYESVMENLLNSFSLKFWYTSDNNFPGLDKYFNTFDGGFNQFAHYWSFDVELLEAFKEISVFLDWAMIYFDFLEQYTQPKKCRKLVEERFKKKIFTDKQKVLALDHMTDFLFASDDPRLTKVYVELIDLRNKILPFDEDPEIDLHYWTIEGIIERSKKHASLLERIKFLEQTKLEYGEHVEDLNFDIGLEAEIQIEINHLEKVIENVDKYEVKKIFSDEIYSTLSLEGYHQLVEFIYQTGVSIEQYSKLTQHLDEERIRDYFIPSLNSASPYHIVTGETYNKAGKTDLIVKDMSGQNLFVAEFKLWKGGDYFRQGLNQLFERYVNWRDQKLAVVVINKDNINFTNIIDKANEIMRVHKLFDEFDFRRHESCYSYIFKHPSDQIRKTRLELILFNFNN